MRKVVLGTLVALLVGSMPVGALSARAATSEPFQWDLPQPNASVVAHDAFAGAVTHTSGVDVSGILQPDGEMELNVGAPADETGARDWVVFLMVPADRLREPRVIAADEPGVAFAPYLSSSGYSCGIQDHGWIDVRDVAVDASGQVTRMWFRFQTSCSFGPTQGEVRWGYGPQAVAPEGFTWATSDVGEDGDSIVVEFPTSVGWRPTAAYVDGRDAADFQVDSSPSCPDVGPCQLVVWFAPTAAGHRQAWLNITGAGRTARLSLEGRGRPGVDQVDVYAPDGDVVTPLNGRIVASAWPRLFTGEAYADSDGHAWGLDLELPSTAAIESGQTYIDDGGVSYPDIGTSRRVAGDSYWIGCRANNSAGNAVVRQYSPGPVDPAVDIEVDINDWCNPSHLRFRYGARADITPPDAARSVTVVDGVVHWDAPADAVRSVVRVRRGGAPTPTIEAGELLYSGPGESVAVPDELLGRAASYTIFSLDDTGNVSAPASVVTPGPGGTVTTPTSSTTRAETRLVAAPSRKVTRPHHRVSITGSATDARWGYLLAGRRVLLDRRAPDGHWRKGIAATTTDVMGDFRFTLRPTTTRYYRVRVLETATYLGAKTAAMRIRVR